MAHLSIPSLCAVSCSPAAFQCLVAVWLVILACCSQLSEPLPGENCASLSIFSLGTLFFLLEMSHGRYLNNRQGWGIRPLPGYLLCPLLLHRRKAHRCLLQQGELLSVSLQRSQSTENRQHQTLTLLSDGDGSHLSLIRRRAQLDSEGLWKCSWCCCWPLCPSRGWGCAAHRESGCLHRDTARAPGSQWPWGNQKIAGRRLFFGSSQIFSAGPKPGCDSTYSLRHAKAVYYTTANKQWPPLDQKLDSLIRSRLDYYFFLMNLTLWKHEPLGFGPAKSFRMCWVVSMWILVLEALVFVCSQSCSSGTTRLSILQDLSLRLQEQCL